MGKKTTAEPESVIPYTEPSALGRDQYEVLVSAIRRIENDLASIDRDLEHDRRDMQDFKIRVSTLESEIRQLREGVNLNAERVKDKVTDAMEPIQEQIQDLTETVEKKRVLSFNKKIGFWGRLFGRK